MHPAISAENLNERYNLGVYVDARSPGYFLSEFSPSRQPKPSDFATRVSRSKIRASEMTRLCKLIAAEFWIINRFVVDRNHIVIYPKVYIANRRFVLETGSIICERSCQIYDIIMIKSYLFKKR